MAKKGYIGVGDVAQKNKKCYIGVAKHLLPSGYTELNYIESTGTQYIDTGVVGRSGVEVYVDLEYASVGTERCGVIGSTGNNVYCRPIYTEKNKFCYAFFGTPVSSSEPTVLANTPYSVYSKMYAGQQLLKVNSETVATGTIGNSPNTQINMYLFALNASGTANTFGSFKCKYCKILLDGTLARELIPCINATGEVGMYDLVSNIFYGNMGTGSFVAGPVGSVARKIKKIYIGDEDGVARLCWEGGQQLITFQVRSVYGTNDYQAAEGMTWAEWCESEYNTDGFFFSDGMLWLDNSYYITSLDGYDVSADGVIVANALYDAFLD